MSKKSSNLSMERNRTRFLLSLPEYLGCARIIIDNSINDFRVNSASGTTRERVTLRHNEELSICELFVYLSKVSGLVDAKSLISKIDFKEGFMFDSSRFYPMIASAIDKQPAKSVIWDDKYTECFENYGPLSTKSSNIFFVKFDEKDKEEGDIRDACWVHVFNNFEHWCVEELNLNEEFLLPFDGFRVFSAVPQKI